MAAISVKNLGRKASGLVAAIVAIGSLTILPVGALEELGPNNAGIESDRSQNGWAEINRLVRKANASLFNEPAKALEIAEQAENIAQNLEAGVRRNQMHATLLWLQAEAFIRLNRLDEAEGAVEHAIDLMGEGDLNSLLGGDLLRARANVARQIGDFRLALESLLKAHDIYEELVDPHRKALTYIQLGSLYAAVNSHEKALDYNKKARAIYSGSWMTELTLYNNDGLSYLALGEYARAAANFEMALVICEDNNNKPILRSRILNNLAAAKVKLGEYDAVEKLTSDALQLIAGTEGVGWVPFIWGNKMQMAVARQDLLRAREYAAKVFAQRPFGQTTDQYRAYHETAYALYAELGELEVALAHLEAFKRLDDQARDLSANAISAMLAVEFDFDQQQAEIEAANARTSFLEMQADLHRQVIVRQRGMFLLAMLMLLGAVVGIWQQRKMKRKLARARNDAVEASLSKSQFLANMSHEIRTPMNGVLGMSELLKGTQLDSRQKMFVDTIFNSGSALLTIINDVLDFSKIEAGKLEFEIRPFDLREAIEDVTVLLGGQARAKNIDLILRFPDFVPGKLEGDQGRIRQVLTNLISNAIKFTDKGYVLIDVSGEKAGEDLSLNIKVIDTGIGIEQDNLTHVFDQFTQAEKSTTREFGGTGLGLAISKNLISAMGGSVEVSSVPGEGSTFTVSLTLPLSTAEPPAIVNTHLLAREQVLIVGSSEPSREVLFNQIKAWGMEPKFVRNEIVAIDLLEKAATAGKQLPYVVLDDSSIVSRVGKFVGKIKRNPEIADAPVIALSGHDTDADDLLGYKKCAILLKPCRRSMLLDAFLANHCEPDNSANNENSLSSPDDEPGNATPRWRVLIAEDNEVNRFVIESMLATEKVSITFAENGRIAVDLFRDGAFDFVFMDVSMPVMDGLEATTAIREFERTASRKPTPIIALTAHAMSGDREKFLAYGMDDYITKPVKKADVQGVIERLESEEGLQIHQKNAG